MTNLIATLLLVATQTGQVAPPVEQPMGWLWGDQPSPLSARPYEPHEGDLVFMSHTAPLRTAAYLAFRTGHPLHCALLVRSPDGVLAVFETGGGQKKVTTLQPVARRFHEHLTTERDPVLWIRPIRRPLTSEESARLTGFALAELAKPLQPNYRYLRLIIPGRPTHASRDGQSQWFCSELVAQGLIEAGLLQTRLPAGSLVPADLFYDRRIDLSAVWAAPCQWTEVQHLPTNYPRLAPVVVAEPAGPAAPVVK
jgi:hypothetical protein